MTYSYPTRRRTDWVTVIGILLALLLLARISLQLNNMTVLIEKIKQDRIVITMAAPVSVSHSRAAPLPPLDNMGVK